MTHWKPRCHLTPPRGWMNDPNGPIRSGSTWHVFFQWNPNGESWGDIHWGHAESADLVRWRNLPVALSPSRAIGEEHCFSGCCVMDNGRPVILYTSVDGGGALRGAVQRLAHGSADLSEWKKAVEPFLTPDIHGGTEVLDWRDPFAWKEGETWYLVLGGSVEGRGAVLLYQSAKLDSGWEYLGVLASGEEVVWECPNFFRLGDKWVLLYSSIGDSPAVRYRVGIFDGRAFLSEREGTFDHGGRPGYYAPATFDDGEGRRIAHGWLPEDDRAALSLDVGWNGALALPRELSLTAEGELSVHPAREAESLRKAGEDFGAEPLEGFRFLKLKGSAMEFLLELAWTDPGAEFRLGFFADEDLSRGTVLRFLPATGKLVLDRTASSTLAGLVKTPVEMPINTGGEKRIGLRVFIDGSTVEIFAGGSSLSARVYPDSEEALHAWIGSDRPGAFRLESGKAWKLGL